MCSGGRFGPNHRYTPPAPRHSNNNHFLICVDHDYGDEIMLSRSKQNKTPEQQLAHLSTQFLSLCNLSFEKVNKMKTNIAPFMMRIERTDYLLLLQN